MCRNAEAFKKRVGFLGIDIQAERLLKAFVSRGLELRDDIKYYAPDVNADVECLPVKPASKHEVSLRRGTAFNPLKLQNKTH